MKIKSFGCSFVFGSDLPDLPDEKVSENPCGSFSQLTWPAIVAKRLGLSYQCHARPGAGNLQTAERVLNEIDNDPSAIYVIDWTWIDRFDYIFSDDPWQPWATLRPSSESDITEYYFRNLQSEYRDKLTTLICIKTVVDVLKQKQARFVMTYEDDLMFDKKWHMSAAIHQLQTDLKPVMSRFEGMTFLNWSRSHGFSESKKWHPLEDAHQAAADIMQPICHRLVQTTMNLK